MTLSILVLRALVGLDPVEHCHADAMLPFLCDRGSQRAR
jgi:hypothetical protein